MKDLFPILTFAISVVITGAGALFRESAGLFGGVLIVAGLLIMVSAISWLSIENVPRIHVKQETSAKAAKKIYGKASCNGGIIYATHVFPNNNNPLEDFALNALRDSSNGSNLTFHRVLILDSNFQERNWLTKLFEDLPKTVQKKFYVLGSYPLVLPRIVKALLPRLNILLYQSPSGWECRTLVGLDHLEIGNIRVNFVVTSRSKKVFRVLQKYFEHITGSNYFRTVTSIEEYYATRRVTSAIERGQDVVSRISEFGETTSGISFIGLFGSMAKSALGLSKNFVDETEADVDLIIVYDPYEHNEQTLQNLILDHLDSSHQEVTWGPDLSSFYTFRSLSHINIDIELHTIGSSFYNENRLLGYSVFQYFFPVYSQSTMGVSHYLPIPSNPLRMEERISLIINDRQGLRMFRDRIADSNQNADPRRLTSHVLRNIVWAVSGYWPRSSQDAADYLSSHPDWQSISCLQESSNLITKTQAEVQGQVSRYNENLKKMIDDALDLLTSTFQCP